jgi:hypothetical protein
LEKQRDGLRVRFRAGENRKPAMTVAVGAAALGAMLMLSNGIAISPASAAKANTDAKTTRKTSACGHRP